MENILFVDGNAAICRAVVATFDRRPGTCLESVRFGGQAAIKLREKKYQLAIIDISLPDISGYRLAAMAAIQDCPALLMSGYPEAFDECDAFKWPHIKKPFAASRLLRASDRVIAQTTRNIEQVRASAARMEASKAALKNAIEDSRQLLSRIRAQRAE